MTIVTKESTRLAWLAATLDEQRFRLLKLFSLLKGLGLPFVMKPARLRKFLCTLEQIAIEKEKEMQIIGRIEAIENRHRFQRISKKLKHAWPAPKPAKYVDPALEPAPKYVRCDNHLIWVLGLIYLVMRRGINQKRQSLTVR